MSTIAKLIKAFLHPTTVFRNRLYWMRSTLRFAGKDDYKSEAYWRDRHNRFGFDLRGVGGIHLTESENQRILDEGGRLMLEFIQREKIDLSTARMLDVGCGTGYYADVFRKAGGHRYVGIDIVDTLFDGLRSHMPGFEFRKLDVATQPLTGEYDLIIMMDVAQHIVNDSKFRYAMENIQSHLVAEGLIIISTDIGPEFRWNTFYCVTRPFSVYQEIFAGYRLSELVPFYTNSMFSIRRIGANSTRSTNV